MTNVDSLGQIDDHVLWTEDTKPSSPNEIIIEPKITYDVEIKFVGDSIKQKEIDKIQAEIEELNKKLKELRGE